MTLDVRRRVGALTIDVVDVRRGSWVMNYCVHVDGRNIVIEPRSSLMSML